MQQAALLHNTMASASGGEAMKQEDCCAPSTCEILRWLWPWQHDFCWGPIDLVWSAQVLLVWLWEPAVIQSLQLLEKVCCFQTSITGTCLSEGLISSTCWWANINTILCSTLLTISYSSSICELKSTLSRMVVILHDCDTGCQAHCCWTCQSKTKMKTAN